MRNEGLVIVDLAKLRAMRATVEPLTIDGYARSLDRCAPHRGGDDELPAKAPYHLVIPPQLHLIARAILSYSHLAGTAEIVCEPALSDEPSRWYIVGQLSAEAMTS